MAKRKRHRPEQIAAILKQREAGLKLTKICRKHGISEQTFFAESRSTAAWARARSSG